MIQLRTFVYGCWFGSVPICNNASANSCLYYVHSTSRSISEKGQKVRNKERFVWSE